MKKNIVLIGMPGCGKTTIGRELAKRLGFSFVDSDEEIVNQVGTSISEIFALNGEKAFRDLERQVVFKLSKYENTVISTGGGVVLRKENIESLKENGYIIFIDRPLEFILSGIETESRPLLKKQDALKELYSQRYDLYNKYCDLRVENSGELCEVINSIYNLIKEVL